MGLENIYGLFNSKSFKIPEGASFVNESSVPFFCFFSIGMEAFITIDFSRKDRISVFEVL